MKFNIKSAAQAAKAHLGWVLFLGFIAACIIVGNVKSATLSGTAGVAPSYGMSNIFRSNGIVVYKITLTTTNGAGSSYITFWDSPYNSNFVYIAGYTNVTLVSGTYSGMYTNIAGGTNSFSYTLYTNQVSAAPTSSNYFRKLWEVTIPPGTNTVVYAPTFPLLFETGICVTNNDMASNFTYSIEYLNYR